MDLSLGRLDREARTLPLAKSLDIVLATTAGRQAATPTARLATRMALGSSSPIHGAFDHETAELLNIKARE